MTGDMNCPFAELETKGTLPELPIHLLGPYGIVGAFKNDGHAYLCIFDTEDEAEVMKHGILRDSPECGIFVTTSSLSFLDDIIRSKNMRGYAMIHYGTVDGQLVVKPEFYDTQ